MWEWLQSSVSPEVWLMVLFMARGWSFTGKMLCVTSCSSWMTAGGQRRHWKESMWLTETPASWCKTALRVLTLPIQKHTTCILSKSKRDRCENDTDPITKAVCLSAKRWICRISLLLFMTAIFGVSCSSLQMVFGPHGDTHDCLIAPIMIM